MSNNPPSSSSNSRSNIIDALRGLAAFAVLLFHYFGFLRFANPPLNWTERVVLGITSFGYLGVPVFFVVSGYVIAMTTLDLKFTGINGARFFFRRFLRIAIPYWFMVLVTASTIYVGHIVGRFETVEVSGIQVLAHLVYAQDILGFKALNDAFWTLCLEVQFYAIFALASVAFRFLRLSLDRIFLCWVLSVILSFTLDCFECLNQCWAPRLWYQFGLGILAYQSTVNCRQHVNAIVFFALFLLASLVLYRIELVVLSCTAFLLLFKKNRAMFNRVVPAQLIHLGAISYSIYLVHGYLGMLLNSAVKSPPILSIASPLMVISTAVILAVTAAIIFHRFIEIPGIKVSKRIQLGSKLT